MAKAQTFADKMAKAKMAGIKMCPTCNETYSFVKKVTPAPKGTGKYGFNETVVRYCKCTAKQTLEA